MPPVPAYTADELRALGVTRDETDSTILVTIPWSAQQRFIGDVIDAGIARPFKAVSEIVRSALTTLGLSGSIKTRTDDYEYIAWVDKRRMPTLDEIVKSAEAYCSPDPLPKAQAAPSNTSSTIDVMTTEGLLALHQETCDSARAMIRTKNHDYTDGSADPYANFRTAETIGVSAETGVLIRVLDKIKRIQTFVNKGQLHVKGESVNDAIEDAINYFVLLKGIIIGRRNAN